MCAVCYIQYVVCRGQLRLGPVVNVLYKKGFDTELVMISWYIYGDTCGVIVIISYRRQCLLEQRQEFIGVALLKH